MQLVLIVGKNPDDHKVFGYKASKPMFGTLSSSHFTINSLEVNIESGDIKVKCDKPIFGPELTLVTETGMTAILQYDTSTGSYISTGKIDFAQYIVSHIGGVCNLKATMSDNKTTKKSKKKRKSKAKKD